MGNVLDKVPTDYSDTNPTKMQPDSWLQTYRHDPYAHTDRIPWGTKGSHLSIGVKVLQQVPGKDLYVMNTHGQKIFITKNGVQLPNASSLITQGANYGLGPLVEILGPPTNPEYYMWSGTDMTDGPAYKPVKINSMSDLQFAMTQNMGTDADPTAMNNQHSGQYGMASISGPFQKIPKDIWSAVGVENKAIGAVGSQLVVPLVADAISNVIPGFGMVTQATGLQQDLTNALTTAMSSYKKSMQHQGTSSFDTSMANTITDPRLFNYYDEASAGYKHMATQTQTHDQSLLAMSNTTPEQQLLKTRALIDKAGDMQANQNATQLESLMAQVKVKYPKLNWGYYDQLQSGIAAASTPEQKLNILAHFSDKLIADVKVADTPAQNTQSAPEKGPHGIPTMSSVPPTGAGFGPVSWNPLVINGSFPHEPQKVVIHG